MTDKKAKQQIKPLGHTFNRERRCFQNHEIVIEIKTYVYDIALQSNKLLIPFEAHQIVNSRIASELESPFYFV